MIKLEHSCKVPKLYKVSSKILQLVKEKGASLKELVFDKGENKKLHHPNTKGVYALVVSSIQNGTILDELIRKSNILIKEPLLDPWLARILIVELLWGKKKLPVSNAKPITTVMHYQPAILGILREAVKSGSHENKPRRNEGVTKPRYVRVNTLMMSVRDAIKAFCNEGWQQATYPADDYTAFFQKLSTLAEDEFIQDFHVKELFAFAPRTEFHKHALYRNGSLVLQDKATCLPPLLLNPEPGSAVLDMCAAPGMKTTQLAAIMGNKGTLYAVERHLPRYRKLCQMMPHHGVKCATTINADATTVTPEECREVKYILVDPTCSGSGMDRPKSEDEDTDKIRLQKLSEFQVILLEKALTKFPSVRRVVYSTCSVYAEENEEVVQKVLATVNKDPVHPRFKLAQDVLTSWPNRGSSNYEVGPRCIVTRPEKDLTTGCFIAIFERVEEQTSIADQSNAHHGVGEEQHTKKRKRNKRKQGVKTECNLSITSGTVNINNEKDLVRKRKKLSENELNNTDIPSSMGKKKKKKVMEEVSEVSDIVQAMENIKKNKGLKKKKKKVMEEVSNINGIGQTMENIKKNKGLKKKKKKIPASNIAEMEDITEGHGSSIKIVKKKKKKVVKA